MGTILEFVITAPLIIQIVLGVLLVLTAIFAVAFLMRAVRMVFILSNFLRDLRAVNDHRKQNLESTFSINTTFSHLWKEYRDTLHQQQEFEPNGKLRTTIFRSTVPASIIFTNDVIVDNATCHRILQASSRHLHRCGHHRNVLGTYSVGSRPSKFPTIRPWFAKASKN